MGEDIQARTFEIWKYPAGRFFATYAFTFTRPNKWKQTNPSAEAGRYVGQLELQNRVSSLGRAGRSGL